MWPRRRRSCRSTSSTGSSATPRRTGTPTSASSAASRFCIRSSSICFAAHPDCYFQVFTNGQLITDEIARELARLGNVTPLLSIEGSEIVSDERRGRTQVLTRTLEGLEACRRHRLLIGVATSVCQTNVELVSEAWLRRLIAMGVHYVWFHTYRVVGPKPNPQLALRPEQVLAVRRFIVQMRARLPIAIVDAYWDDRGEALCPMATGVSHHIGPGGHIEPCPVIQFATSTVRDGPSIYETMTQVRVSA